MTEVTICDKCKERIDDLNLPRPMLEITVHNGVDDDIAGGLLCKVCERRCRGYSRGARGMSETTRADFLIGSVILVVYVVVGIVVQPAFPEPFGIAMFVLYCIVYWVGLDSWFDMLESYKSNQRA